MNQMQSAFCVQCKHTVLMTTDQAQGEDEVRCVDHDEFEEEIRCDARDDRGTGFDRGGWD